MYELRWILLLAGVVLVVGLWIHETRRTKAAERARQRDPGAERVDPWVAEDVAAPDRTAVEMPHLRDPKPLEPGIENAVAQVVWAL